MGIYSYQPEDKDVFWGRDVEKREVADTILNNFSTILSGSSGCGKTSLINAGVIPILDKCSYCAIRITPRRIWEKYCANGSEGRGDFAIYFWEEVDIEIEKRIKNDVDVCGRYYKSDIFSLWEKIFLCDFKKNRCKLYFLVIVDQFEEIFQLNLNIKEINRFFKIYEIMSNSYSPYYDYIQMINFNFETYSASKKLFPDRDIYEKFYSKLSTNNRFLISIRKDFLFELQSYSKYYPVLSQNVYYLENLDDDQAAIVIRSGCEEFQKLNTKEITGCIIEKYDFEDNDGEVDYRVDTLTLSMVMYEIWEKFERQEDGYDSVENITKDFKNKFDVILSDFYQDRIKSLMVGSEKGKKKKIDNLKNLIINNNFKNIQGLKGLVKKLIRKYINNTDGRVYGENEIGTYLDAKIKRLIDNNSAFVAKNDLTDELLTSSYDNIRQEIINTLKRFSLIDSINRCCNSIVIGRLKSRLNQIIFELQEKLLSDSRLFRQSVYIEDVCKLFDNAIYGEIDFERKREWFAQLIKNGIIDDSNGLLEICGIVNDDDFKRKIICKMNNNDNIVKILKDNDLYVRKDTLQVVGSFNQTEWEFDFMDNNYVIDMDKFCSYLSNTEFNSKKLYVDIVYNKGTHEKNLQISLPCHRYLIFKSVRIKDIVSLFIKFGWLKFDLVDSKKNTDEDKAFFREKLNKYVYRTKDGFINSRREIADVITNCKLFTELNKGKKENMLEFRHDRLCAMANEYIEIHKIRRYNAKRYTPDVYFTPQGRLKEGNCFVEAFLGPWNTYSTVMSSMYFMEGDKSRMVDFDTESITQLKSINYTDASSSIVTIALNERFGMEFDEFYHDLPTYFTHFRVKIEDNKIYNISFETREKNDTNIKKVVVSTGFHKVRFYYDQYDRVILKEFCVRKNDHKEFYETDAAESGVLIKDLPQDVRVKLPEVGYNAIYYKYDKISYKCPSETYFLNIKLSQIKDLREYAREGSMSVFYAKLEEDIQHIKNFASGKNQNLTLEYVVKHVVDGNFGYKSEYDNYGCEKSRKYFGGTMYGFDMIKLEYDKSDNMSGNIKSIAFFKDSKAATYHYPFKAKNDDSNIHKIELIPVVSDYGICKMTKYFDKNNNECYDKSKNPIKGKKYTYTYEVQNDNHNYLKPSFFKELTAEYLWNVDKKVSEMILCKRVHKMVVSQIEDANNAILSIESFNSNGEKIDGRSIVKGANIFNYESQKKGEKVVKYHKIEFKYTRGLVKTHIFTTKDKKDYEYFISRSGNVCERKRFRHSLKVPRSIEINDSSINIHNSITMIYVNGGVFKMGHNADSDYPFKEAVPEHNVLVDSFYIGQTTVTVGLWNSIMPAEKKCKGKKCYPAVNVKWDDVCEFIEKLNNLESVKEQKLKFRLPTEAEWEYAARGGEFWKKTDYKYSGSNNIAKVAVCKGNIGRLSCVGEGRMPNKLGIFDMSGNVKEWCSDYFWLYPNTFGKTVDNPVGPSTGYARVVRGGGFKSEDHTCRVYNRDCSFPDVKKDDIGFRLVLEVEN